MTLRLVCASANPDKVTEMTAALDGIVELEPRPPELAEIVEDAPDLEGNARLKAVAVCDAAGRPAIADDTGLEVDALDGAPGVTSARYAGEGAGYADNVTKLLSELEGVEHAGRGARFRTVALIRWPDGSELAAEGEVVGRIAEAARGENGFGYDSVFVPVEGDGRTFAQMSGPEKEALSHRGRALRALTRRLVATNSVLVMRSNSETTGRAEM
jgi:XTP/dITP diphosphohydrolase